MSTHDIAVVAFIALGVLAAALWIARGGIDDD